MLRPLPSALVSGLAAVALVLAAGCSAGGSSGGFGDGGTAAEGGAASDGGGGGPTGCGTKEAHLSGTLDGTAVDRSYSSNGYALVLKDFSGTVGSRGNLQVSLSQAGASSAGTPIAAGVLKMPTDGPFAGESFCVGGGSLARASNAYTFTLTSLSRLPAGADAGACPGAAVTGELTGCIGPGK